MNKPARFTVADATRALLAAKRLGATYAIEIMPDGTIRIVPIAADTQQVVEPVEEIVL